MQTGRAAFERLRAMMIEIMSLSLSNQQEVLKKEQTCNSE